MAYISDESKFWSFMESNGPNADKSKSNYVSWLKFVIINGYGAVDSSLRKESVERIHQKLTNNKKERAVYKTDKDIKNIRSALNKYLKFVEASKNRRFGLHNDLLEILKYENLTAQEREIEIRVGQGKYRTELIKLWVKCSVTKYSRTDFLVASHIKPWKESSNFERLDPYNGLLLMPNIDVLFDSGYIGFSNKGEIIISDLLDTIDKDKMGISESMKLHKIFNENLPYLTYHRNNILLK